MSSIADRSGRQIHLARENPNYVELYGHHFPERDHKWLLAFDLKLQRGYCDWQIAKLAGCHRSNVTKKFKTIKHRLREILADVV